MVDELGQVMKNGINSLRQSILQTSWILSDLLFPRHCRTCDVKMSHENRFLICDICFQKISFLSGQACRGCAKFFPGFDGSQGKGFCPGCARDKRFFDECFSVAIYEGVIKELLQSFKYAREEYLAHTLQMIFGKVFERNIPWNEFDCMVPVPLHPLKLKERGFNQSLFLAQELYKKLKIPLFPTALKRVKYSQGQTLQDKKARIENIRDSFVVKSTQRIQNKRVLLVDDVLTTEATVQECAKILKASGAVSVTVLTLARSM